MLVESVYMHIKNIGLFFHGRLHHTVPSVKMTDVLASYISHYKFEFSLRIANCKFQLKVMSF